MCKRAELRELCCFEPVGLMIKKGRLRWFGHVELKDWIGFDWINPLTAMKIIIIIPTPIVFWSKSNFF